MIIWSYWLEDYCCYWFANELLLVIVFMVNVILTVKFQMRVLGHVVHFSPLCPWMTKDDPRLSPLWNSRLTTKGNASMLGWRDINFAKKGEHIKADYLLPPPPQWKYISHHLPAYYNGRSMRTVLTRMLYVFNYRLLVRSVKYSYKEFKKYGLLFILGLISCNIWIKRNNLCRWPF